MVVARESGFGEKLFYRVPFASTIQFYLVTDENSISRFIWYEYDK